MIARTLGNPLQEGSTVRKIVRRFTAPLALVLALGALGGVSAAPALAQTDYCSNITYSAPSWVSGTHFAATISFQGCTQTITKVVVTDYLFANTWPAGYGEGQTTTILCNGFPGCPVGSPNYANILNAPIVWPNYCPAGGYQWWGWVPYWTVYFTDGQTGSGNGAPSSGNYTACA